MQCTKYILKICYFSRVKLPSSQGRYSNLIGASPDRLTWKVEQVYEQLNSLLQVDHKGTSRTLGQNFFSIHNRILISMKLSSQFFGVGFQIYFLKKLLNKHSSNLTCISNLNATLGKILPRCVHTRLYQTTFIMCH